MSNYFLTLNPLIMADFRNLEVYKQARKLNKEVYLLIRNPGYDHNIKDQLTRAATSVMLNIAEGSGRWGRKEKRQFFSFARGSALECLAIFDIIEDLELLSLEKCDDFRKQFGRISKMLFGLMRHFEKAV